MRALVLDLEEDGEKAGIHPAMTYLLSVFGREAERAVPAEYFPRESVDPPPLFVGGKPVIVKMRKRPSPAIMRYTLCRERTHYRMEQRLIGDLRRTDVLSVEKVAACEEWRHRRFEAIDIETSLTPDAQRAFLAAYRPRPWVERLNLWWADVRNRLSAS